MPIFANKLSGVLLDINFQAICESNKRVTTENANLFGLSWIGDGATIERMPLLNMLAMCRSKTPGVIAILKLYWSHGGWWKKDAEFVISFFQSKVDEFDPGKTLTNTSFLMGQQMFRKWGKFCVHISHRQCVSMEEKMFCHYF